MGDDNVFYVFLNDQTLAVSKPDGESMSKIMEEMMYEVEYRKAVEIAEHLVAKGKHTLEEIAEDTGLTLIKVQELAALK